MKKLFLLLSVVIFTSCTNNQLARKYGGTETLQLPKGQRLINVSWKEDDLWLFTEAMPDDYEPKIKTYKEKSSFGFAEGTIIFVESR